MTNIPTDAELWQLYIQQPGQHKDPIGFARAVLARWGQPAHSGEPVECDCRNPYSHDECTQQAGCKIKTKLSRKTHQPVKREPLPSVEIMRIILEVERQHNVLRGMTNWAAAVGRAVERAHGIGGQHGTE